MREEAAARALVCRQDRIIKTGPSPTRHAVRLTHRDARVFSEHPADSRRPPSTDSQLTSGICGQVTASVDNVAGRSRSVGFLLSLMCWRQIDFQRTSLSSHSAWSLMIHLYCYSRAGPGEAQPPHLSHTLCAAINSQQDSPPQTHHSARGPFVRQFSVAAQ